jgi:hypothetical protein
MFISADQLLAHAIGDYVLQSDWMALEKTKKNIAALAHALCYTLPFLFLTTSLPALGFIFSTHFLIDRWRLARYVVWAKNFLSPAQTLGEEISTTWSHPDGRETVEKTRPPVIWWHPWAECVGTGYHKDRPPWLAVWLLIIADNVLHVCMNGIALKYL